MSMSARTKKSKQTQEVEHAKTTRSRSHERSTSPINISRQDEKDEMIHLNNRLATYIEFVRKLERDKEILKRQIHSFTEEKTLKSDECRKTFENEIASLRLLVDNLAKDKAAADLKANKSAEDAANAKCKLSKRDIEIRNLERKQESMERDLAAYKQDHDRYAQLKPEYDSLEKRYEVLRRDLEAEMILRTDLENKVAGLREEIDFKNKLHNEEREQLVCKRVFVQEEIEDKMAAEYESRLADELEAFRKQTADGLAEYRNDMEETFRNKLDQLRAANKDASEDSRKTRDELMLLRRRADDLNGQLAVKNSEIEKLKERVEDLENMLAHERGDFEAQLANQRDKVKRLQAELELRFSEFADLMHTKIALDQEILMYRKMLEGEESRLKISAQGRKSAFSQPTVTKRRRIDADEEELNEESGEDDDNSSFDDFSSTSNQRYSFSVTKSSKCGVEFTSDQDGQGKWVKLVNTSDKDVHLGNWMLKHQADSGSTSFKFHRTVALKPNATCTIWSSDANGTHNPPYDIVMKNQAFKASGNVAIVLLDADGVEQAKCSVVRERIRFGSSLNRARALRGDHGSNEKCFLM